jgi:hypothetical protein
MWDPASSGLAADRVVCRAPSRAAGHAIICVILRPVRLLARGINGH